MLLIEKNEGSVEGVEQIFNKSRDFFHKAVENMLSIKSIVNLEHERLTDILLVFKNTTNWPTEEEKRKARELWRCNAKMRPRNMMEYAENNRQQSVDVYKFILKVYYSIKHGIVHLRRHFASIKNIDKKKERQKPFLEAIFKCVSGLKNTWESVGKCISNMKLRTAKVHHNIQAFSTKVICVDHYINADGKHHFVNNMGEELLALVIESREEQLSRFWFEQNIDLFVRIIRSHLQEPLNLLDVLFN